MAAPTRSIQCPQCRTKIEVTLGQKLNCPVCKVAIEVRSQQRPAATNPQPSQPATERRPAHNPPTPAATNAPPPLPVAEVLPFDDDQPLATANPKRNGPIIAAVVAAVLLIGGGVGAFFAFNKKPDEQAKDSDSPPPPKSDVKPDKGKDTPPPRKERTALGGEEMYDRLTRATVFVMTEDSNKKADRFHIGWLLQTDRFLVVTGAEVVHGRQKARVILPAFNEKGEYIRDANYYLSRIANNSTAVIYDAEVVHTDTASDVQLGLLELKPRDKQPAPLGLGALPLAGTTAGTGKKLYSVDVTGWSNGVVLKLVEGMSQGLSKNGKALEIQQVLSSENRGAPIVNEYGEVVATVFGPANARSVSTGIDVERVRVFLKDGFKRPGWAWNDTQVVIIEPREQLQQHLDDLIAATASDHVLDAPGFKPPEPLPALPQAAKEKQINSLRRIARIGDPARAAIPKLARYLHSPDREVRQIALEVLRSFRAVGDLDKPLILACLNSWSIEANTYAAWAYTRMVAPAEATERIGELIKQNDPKLVKAELREQILLAIANNPTNMRQPLARRVLDCLDDRVDSVSEQAYKIINEWVQGGLYTWLVDDLRQLLANSPKWREDPLWRTPDYVDPNNKNARQYAARMLAESLNINLYPYATYREMFFPLLSERPQNVDRIVEMRYAERMRLYGIRALSKWGVQAKDCLNPVAARLTNDNPIPSALGLVDLTTDSIQTVRLAAVNALGAIGIREGQRLVGKEPVQVVTESVELVAWLDKIAETDTDDKVKEAARRVRLTLMEKDLRKSDIALLRKLLRPPTDPSLKDEWAEYRRRAAKMLAQIIEKNKADTSIKSEVASAIPDLLDGVRQKNSEFGADEGLQIACLKVLELVIDGSDGTTGGKELTATIAEILAPVGGVRSIANPDTRPTGTDPASLLLRSTVWIRVNNGQSHGTGVVVEGGVNPLVLTNYHVIAGSRQLTVIFPDYKQGREIGDAKHYESKMAELYRTRQAQPATVVQFSPEIDLALIRLPVRLPDGAAPVRSIATTSAPTGQKLYLRGMSGVFDGALWRFSQGEVRQLVENKPFRYRSGQIVRTTVIEHSIQTNPGDSGGAVVNEKGELVALNCSSDATSRSVAQAIDVTVVRRFLEEHHGREKLVGGTMISDPLTSDAAVSVQSAAIRVLKSLGASSITQLGDSLRKAGGPEQAIEICAILRGLAEKSDAKHRKELVRVCLSLVSLHGTDLKNTPWTDNRVNEATTLLISTVGGAELMKAVWDKTDITKNSVETNAWAIKTLGQFDPHSPWLEVKELKVDILQSSKTCRDHYRVMGDTITDKEAEEIKKRAIKMIEDRLEMYATMSQIKTPSARNKSSQLQPLGNTAKGVFEQKKNAK